MTAFDPVLSAILIVGDERKRPIRALQSILDQNLIDQMEMLLIEISQPDTPALSGSSHPNVRVVTLGPGLPSGYVRAEAVRQARAPIVVFLEEHAVAFPGWAAAIVKAHEGPWAAVGVEFHTGNSGLGLADIAALLYYPLWSPPVQREESEWLPSHNASYKRDVVLGYGNLLDTLFFPEIVLLWKLRQDGQRFLMDPAIKIAHIYETEIGVIMRGNYLSSRSFVHKRSLVFEWPLWKRALRFLLSPVIPLTRTIQLFLIIIRKRPDRLGVFLRGFLYILLYYSAAAAGEMTGLLFGQGNAEIYYLRNQVTDPREMPPDL